MAEVYLINSDLFKRIWDLIEYLEENTPKLIEDNSRVNSVSKEEAKIIQNNIDKMIRIFNDVQEIKDDLRKIVLNNINNDKVKESVLYTGAKIFEKISSLAIEPKKQINDNTELVN